MFATPNQSRILKLRAVSIGIDLNIRNDYSTKKCRGSGDGLVFKAHSRLYHPTLGLGVQKRRKQGAGCRGLELLFPASFDLSAARCSCHGVKGFASCVRGIGFRCLVTGFRDQVFWVSGVQV